MSLWQIKDAGATIELVNVGGNTYDIQKNNITINTQGGDTIVIGDRSDGRGYAIKYSDVSVPTTATLTELRLKVKAMLETGSIATGTFGRAEAWDDLGAVVYHGVAAIGSAQNQAVWVIEKYETVGTVTTKKYSNGSVLENVKFFDRATVTYS